MLLTSELDRHTQKPEKQGPHATHLTAANWRPILGARSPGSAAPSSLFRPTQFGFRTNGCFRGAFSVARKRVSQDLAEETSTKGFGTFEPAAGHLAQKISILPILAGLEDRFGRFCLGADGAARGCGGF